MDFTPAMAARFEQFFVGARLPAKALGQAIPMAQKDCIRGQARSYKYGFGQLKKLR
jgi:hypothetical protein